MSIRTKFRLNMYAFVIVAIMMCVNEFQMRGMDDLMALIPVVTVP